MPTESEASFVTEICLPFLEAARNADGGWGFHPASESRVEPTSWALLGLAEAGASENFFEAGFDYLSTTQLPDGSWPASPTQSSGSWATSLACLALSQNLDSKKALAAGLRWICDDWPRDMSLIQRWIQKIKSPKNLVSQNESLHGWGWTPQTASWVEPTAFALLALEHASPRLFPSAAAERRKLGKALLCDRMCPGGGWNCGNPMVYGVPGDPLVEPTVWALLALREEPLRPEVQQSLAWLGKNLDRIASARSLALSKLCWAIFDRKWPETMPSFHAMHSRNEFLESVTAVAWTCMALGPQPRWLRNPLPREAR